MTNIYAITRVLVWIVEKSTINMEERYKIIIICSLSQYDLPSGSVGRLCVRMLSYKFDGL